MGAREDLLAIPDEVLRRGDVAQAVLVHMDFLDAPQRWWSGFGDLDTGGHLWKGVGDLISVSKIEAAYSISAKQVTFTVAATPTMLELALAAKSRVRDRSVTVFLQLFAGDQPIASPMALYTGTMQRMPWSATGPAKRTITIEAEGLFFRKNSAPRGRWTDTDQRARYPLLIDKGFERLPRYANGYDVKWRS